MIQFLRGIYKQWAVQSALFVLSIVTVTSATAATSTSSKVATTAKTQVVKKLDDKSKKTVESKGKAGAKEDLKAKSKSAAKINDKANDKAKEKSKSDAKAKLNQAKEDKLKEDKLKQEKLKQEKLKQDKLKQEKLKQEKAKKIDKSTLTDKAKSKDAKTVSKDKSKDKVKSADKSKEVGKGKSTDKAKDVKTAAKTNASGKDKQTKTVLKPSTPKKATVQRDAEPYVVPSAAVMPKPKTVVDSADLSEQDIISEVKRAVNLHEELGMDGLQKGSERCYTLETNQNRCLYFDLAARKIDLMVAQTFNSPLNMYFDDTTFGGRLIDVYSKSGKSVEQANEFLRLASPQVNSYVVQKVKLSSFIK